MSCSCRWILPVMTGFGHCCNSEVTEILLALLWSLGASLSIPHLLIWGLAGSFSSHSHLPTYSCYFALSLLLIYPEICSLSICQCFALQEKNHIPSLWGSVLKENLLCFGARLKLHKDKNGNSLNVVLSVSNQQSFALHKLLCLIFKLSPNLIFIHKILWC